MLLVMFRQRDVYSGAMNHSNEIYFTDKHIKKALEMQSIICFPRENMQQHLFHPEKNANVAQ